MPWIRAWDNDDISQYVDRLQLAKKNEHPRDSRIAFRDQDHTYFVKTGENAWIKLKTSVSGLYSKFFNKFDTEAASLTVARKRKLDRNSPYYWLIQHCEDPRNETLVARRIQEAWNLAGKRASELGTRCHAAMERYANAVVDDSNFSNVKDQDWEPPTDVDAVPLVDAARGWLEARVSEGWRPYRTEWSLFINGARTLDDDDGDLVADHANIVAGQTDLLLKHEDGRFWLVDYKFCGEKKLERDVGVFGKWGKGPLADVPDNSYGHYLAQQSVYAFILKHRYGISVSRSSLLHVPTDETPVRPRLVDLVLLHDATVRAMFSENVEAPKEELTVETFV